MNRFSEHRYYLFGANLALDCIAGGVDIQNYYGLFNQLPQDKRDKLFEELIFFRASSFGRILFSNAIEDKEISIAVADAMFRTLSEELNINDKSAVNKRTLEYFKLSIKLGDRHKDVVYRILENANIYPEQVSPIWFSSFSKFLDDDFTELYDGKANLKGRFERFISTTHSGCFGSVLMLIFVICFLIYVI